MKLNRFQLDKLCKIAKEAAKAAGKVIREAQKEKILVNSKIAGSGLASQIITQTDILAQKTILDILTPSIKEFDLGLLTEESQDDHSRFQKDYFWSIDPLDGTLPFSKNEDGHSTSIALVSKSGIPIIGVVYCSILDNLYYSIKGQGSFKNGTPFKIKSEFSTLTILHDLSFQKDQEIQRINKLVKKLNLEKAVFLYIGGAVIHALSTIEMSPAIYYKKPKRSHGGGSIWDFSATALIVDEAGGVVSDYLNQPLDLNQKKSTFMNKLGIKYCSSQKIFNHF